MLDAQLNDGVLRLVLNNQSNRNALSEAMLQNLQKALDDAVDNKAVRVIIIAALGKVFSAGHDLKEMTKARVQDDGGKEYFTEILSICSHFMQSIVNHPKPIIAQINGIAMAAGCQLVASCDLAYASSSSQFSTPGVHIGLFCSTPMVALSRNIAAKHAMEMLLVGDMVDAQKAQQIGLINAMIDEDKLSQHVMDIASKIAAKSLMTVKTGKQAFYQQAEMKLSNAYHYASDIMVDNMLKHDAIEGINAFIEKREAQWDDS